MNIWGMNPVSAIAVKLRVKKFKKINATSTIPRIAQENKKGEYQNYR